MTIAEANAVNTLLRAFGVMDQQWEDVHPDVIAAAGHLAGKAHSALHAGLTEDQVVTALRGGS